MTDAARGLQYIHSKFIIHGDVKSSNVVLTADGRAKICDFDAAQYETSSNDVTGARLTSTIKRLLSSVKARTTSPSDAGICPKLKLYNHIV